MGPPPHEVEAWYPVPTRRLGRRNVDGDDLTAWVKDLKRTWFGDADLDLEFNSGDLVQVFAAGKYERSNEAGWAEGDWEADGMFTSSDMVAAFVDGGYEQGLRTDALAVPEPGGWFLLVVGLPFCLAARWNRFFSQPP